MSVIAVVGSRDYVSLDWVKVFVREKFTQADCLISGGAYGVDSIAANTQGFQGKCIITVRPNWDMFGKPAGMIRNKVIVDLADIVVAFWDGKSPGTKSTIDLATRLGKRLFVVRDGRIDDFNKLMNYFIGENDPDEDREPPEVLGLRPC